MRGAIKIVSITPVKYGAYDEIDALTVKVRNVKTGEETTVIESAYQTQEQLERKLNQGMKKHKTR